MNNILGLHKRNWERTKLAREGPSPTAGTPEDQAWLRPARWGRRWAPQGPGERETQLQEGRPQSPYCPGGAKPECRGCSSSGLCEEVSRLRGGCELAEQPQALDRRWRNRAACWQGCIWSKQETAAGPGRASSSSCGVSPAPSTDRS